MHCEGGAAWVEVGEEVPMWAEAIAGAEAVEGETATSSNRTAADKQEADEDEEEEEGETEGGVIGLLPRKWRNAKGASVVSDISVGAKVLAQSMGGKRAVVLPHPRPHDERDDPAEKAHPGEAP